MRNLKKIVAVIMAVAIIASMMVPALAAVSNEDKAKALQTIGLFKGNGASFDLDLKLSREQGMALIVRALGAEKAALAMSQADIDAQLANVTDADKIATWAKPYAAYCLANNITKGIGGAAAGKVMYGAQLDIYGDQFVILLLRAMGYTAADKDNCWDIAVAAKVLTAGQAVALKFNGGIIRDDAAGVLYSAVKTGMTADGKTSLIAKLIADKAVDQATAAAAGFAEAPAPVALAAEVKVLNLKQIQLTFNKEVDKDTAEKVANYVVKDKGETELAISGASIAADLKTVTLTLANQASASNGDKYLTNNTTAKVTFKKDFKDAAGVKTAADTTYEVAVGDTTFPTFDSVEAKGNKLLRLYFSEPLKNVAAANFTIKSGSYTWSVVSAKQDVAGKYVDLTLGTSLIEGVIDVKVSNALKDYADLIVFEKTINYTFAKVATAPTATISKAEPDKIEVKFDRPVYGNLVVYHSVKNYATYQSIVNLSSEADAKDTIEFKFAENNVPAGNITIYVAAQKDKEVKDLYGNKYVDQSFTVTVTNDTTAPVVKETKLEKGDYFQVTFDEAIKWAGVGEKPSNYAIKKVSDGSTVYFSIAKSNEDKTVTFTPASTFADNTEYELTIKKVEDARGNANTADIVLTFKTGDNNKPKVSDDTFAVNDDGKIYIYFSEAMNATEMAKKVNYVVLTNSAVGDYKTLGDKDTVTVVNEKLVLIDLDDKVSSPRVKISTMVTDLAGNKFDGVAGLEKTTNPIGIETFKMDKAEAIAKDKIKITFNREVGQFASNNLSVSGIDDVTSVAIAAVESVSGKEVVIKLDKELKTDATLNGVNVSVTAITTTGIKTIYGSVLAEDDTQVIKDKVAPEVLKDSTRSDSPKVYAYFNGATATTDSSVTVSKASIMTIEIEYSETIDASTLSKLTYTVDGYEVMSVARDVTDLNIVVITIKANEDKTTMSPSVTQVYNIKDHPGGNIFASGTTWNSISIVP